MSRMLNLTTPTTRTVTVTVSGTPVQGPDVNVPDGIKVTVRAHPDNTGTITVAESSANAVNSGSSCNRLTNNQSEEYQVQNFSQIWFDATVSGEKVLLTTTL